MFSRVQQRIRRFARSRVQVAVAAAVVVIIAAASVVVGVGLSAQAATPAFDPNDTIKPVASYTFDTASGTTVTDSSGNANNAAWKGTPSYVAGISGNGAAVSGGANYIKLPLVTGVTDASASFSYEFWMSETSRTSYGPIVSNQNFAACNNAGMTLYNQATQGVLESCWGLTSGGTKEYVHSISTNLVGAWHHVAVVVNRVANTETFYVDGVQKSTAAAGTITASTAFNSGLAFNIGGLSGSEADSGDGYTNATIDDFNYYSAAIPASQVAADYAASQPNAVEYTVAFNGNSSTSGSMASEDMPAGQSLALTTNTFARTGYQFSGWATSASGPVVYADGQTVSRLSSTSGATVTLYAVWHRYRAAGDTVAPVVSYDFDTASGSTVTDSSGAGNAGTWSGTPSYATGISGQAAYVNSPAGSTAGVNYFSLPLIAGVTDASSSFSYVFWFNETSSSSDSPIVSNQNFTHCYDQGTTLYNTSGSAGILRGCFGQNGTSTTQNYLANVSSSSVIGTWHQLAVVVDRTAGTMTDYLDGHQTVQSTALTSAFTLASGYPFRVGSDGSRADTGDGFIDGYVDDFDFYSAPVTATQVLNDYNATKPVPPPTNTGATVNAGFVTDTFRAPQVSTGGTVSQPISGLWNGGAITSYSKVSGDDWLSVDSTGTITGTAPADAPADPGTITVQATDGTTTSQLTVEVTVVGATDAPQFASATWNLWDAGAHVSDSKLKDLAVIAANGLDVVGVQDDGGTVATSLAKSLGWYSVEGSGGVGIVSAYPLDADSAAVSPSDLPAIGATMHMLGRDLTVWSVGLDNSAYGPEAACQATSPTASSVVAAEQATKRYTEAGEVATAIAADVTASPKIPLVLLGDLESPSSTDWTAATASSHCGIGAVDWPVPDALTSAGLTDSFRVANPDPKTTPGNTWSPIEATNTTTGLAEPQDRIDYVDFAGKALSVVGSNTLVAGWPSSTDVEANAWTSNHRAVVTTFALAAIPKTPTATSGTVIYQVGANPTDSELLTKAGADAPTAGTTLEIDSSAVDFGTPGSYTAEITATDSSTGTTSAAYDLTVTVVPVITISLGHASGTINLTIGEHVTDAMVEDLLQPTLNVTGTISLDRSQVDDTKSGTYPVTFTGKDSYGFTATVAGSVTISLPVPPASPTLTSTTAVYQVGANPTGSDLLSRLGAQATGSGVTLAIDDSAANFGVAGTYSVSITAVDGSSGLSSKAVVAEVTVVPVIAISLAHATANFTLAKGASLTAAQITAAVGPSLNVPGTVTVDISQVNVAVVGTYPATFTGEDDYGFTVTLGAKVTIARPKASTGGGSSSGASSGATVTVDSSGSATATPNPTTSPSPTPTPTPAPTGTPTPEPTSGSQDAGSSPGHASSVPSVWSMLWLPIGVVVVLLLLAGGAALIILRRRAGRL